MRALSFEPAEPRLLPLAQSPEVAAELLDVVAAAGLVLFARSFSADTVDTRRRARAIMRGVYAAVLLIGGVFLYVAFSAAAVQPRIAVQAAIFIGLGAGGLLMGGRRE